MLRSRVADLGGIISRVAHLDRAVVDVSAVSGICADGRYHQARCVMDATGRRAWLAKKLGLDADTLPLRQRLSFGWSTEVPAELDGQPSFREVSSGWDWVAPVGNGRSSWARLRRSSASGGIEYPWRIFRDCAGFGYFLLGDAASLMDPSAANGVLRAMMSGIYSSHLMRCMNTGTKSWSQAIVEYKRWIGQMFDAAAAARSISLAQ
jgi:flavin-dependent dehydrogenase